MRIIFGDMEFGDFVVDNHTTPICVIHKVKAIMDVDSEFDPESLLPKYGGYIYTENSKYEIVIKPKALASYHVNNAMCK